MVSLLTGRHPESVSRYFVGLLCSCSFHFVMVYLSGSDAAKTGLVESVIYVFSFLKPVALFHSNSNSRNMRYISTGIYR